MDDREFVIPRDKDELQVFTENQYSVQNVYSLDQITDQYLSLRTDLETEGLDFIVEKFELLYGCLVQFQNLSSEVVHEIWDIALEGMRFLVTTLTPMLEDGEEIDDQLRPLVLFKSKMMFYIFSEMIVRCEEKYLQEKASTLPQKGKRKQVEKDSQWNWNYQKNLALTELYRFVKLPLNRLWRPANISEDFLDQMSKCCLKLLEDREIGFVNKKSMRDSIFQILSILCKEYIFGLSLMPKIIQMLMLYEHLAAPLAQSVAQLEEQEGNVGMLKLALQELNGDVDYMAKAGSNCGQFLLELGKSNPKGVCKHLSLITDHLSKEPYNVRMGVIELIGHLLLKVYNEEGLTDQQKDEKEYLYECLFDHLMDLTAFCRSRTLQVWKELCEEEAVSRPILLTALEKVIPCILDKSSTTRKDAIKLMKAFLEHNPFAAKLQAEDLNNQLAKAVGYLKKMEIKAGISAENDMDNFWNENSADIAKITHEVLEAEARKKLAGNVDENAISEEMVENVAVEHEGADDTQAGNAMVQELLSIANLLVEKQYQKAIYLSIKLVKKFDTKNVLGVAASQGATQREREAMLSDLEDESEDEEEGDSQEQALQRKVERKVRIMHRLMHMACLAMQQQHVQDAPPVTDHMKEELQKQQEFVSFLKDSLKFSEQIHSAVEKVLQVLDVSQTTDLAEAIDFIASAQQFGLLTEETGMTRLLCFVHSKDLALKNTVTAAYKKIYLYSMNREGQETTHEDVIEAMKKVCLLVQQSPTIYERSLKALVQAWVTGGDINSECIDVLWEMVAGKKKEECIAAMNLLHMVLESNPRNIQEHLHYLEKYGLGKRGGECFELAKNTCKVLSVISPKLKSDSDDDPYKLAIDEEIFRHLSEIIVSGMFKLNDKDYCDMLQAAMFAIFKSCEQPTDLMGKILHQICISLEEHSNQEGDKTLTEETTEADTQESQSKTVNTQASKSEEKGQSLELSQEVLMRLMEVLSCCMGELFVFLMNEVLVEMRRHRYLADKDKELKKNTTIRGDDDSDSSMCSVSSVIQILPSLTEEEALDRIAFVTNVEVLDPNNTLGKFIPMIEEICQKPHTYTHPGLQISAVQALGRAMLLSKTYCSSKLRLFCTIMVKSTDHRVRIAAIHAMADLLRRFPNEVDPYSPNLYECLKDQTVVVRREALVVLSKLILGDMLRVKFQISYLAACLTDSDDSCKDIASFFFATLATKGNILYNLVLDMISQLSREESEKNQKEFETIMRVILPYIDKERQVVSLVEKLCSRFPEKTSEQECHNIALCISILPVSLKSVRTLKDNFNFYADKLKYVTVKITFDGILQTARKQFKGENKESLEDFQENLDKCCDKQAVKDAVAQMKTTNVKEKEKAKAAKPKRGRAKKKVDSSDESEDDVATQKSGRNPAALESDGSDTEATTSSRSGRAAASKKPQRGGNKRAKPVSSESDDSAFEEPQTPVRAAAKTPSRTAKTPAASAKKQTRKAQLKEDTNPRRSGRTRSSIRL